MFISRRLNPSTGAIELWECEWENLMGAPAKKVYNRKVTEERRALTGRESATKEAAAICWSYGRTLGNIAVFSQAVSGTFASDAGDDAELPCEFVEAGKFRNGAERWWCRTHQTHWGTKADQAAFAEFREMRCANHQQLMNYVLSPMAVNLSENAEVGVWCSMPAAISTAEIKNRPPRIHVHVRREREGKKLVDQDFRAISVLYQPETGLFDSSEITRVNITPPAAFDFVTALEAKRPMDCIDCSYCGYPHLDLGDFALKPHSKHFCANCGRDSTWSKEPIVSTPLKPLHDSFAKTVKLETPDRKLNLDEYSGCSYTVWASTPAIIWTAERPQEFGIHVHVHKGRERIVDDTFGDVILNRKSLDRGSLIKKMIERSIT